MISQTVVLVVSISWYDSVAGIACMISLYVSCFGLLEDEQPRPNLKATSNPVNNLGFRPQAPRLGPLPSSNGVDAM